MNLTFISTCVILYNELSDSDSIAGDLINLTKFCYDRISIQIRKCRVKEQSIRQ